MMKEEHVLDHFHNFNVICHDFMRPRMLNFFLINVPLTNIEMWSCVRNVYLAMIPSPRLLKAVLTRVLH